MSDREKSGTVHKARPLVGYQITGYDPVTEQIVSERKVPKLNEAEIKAIAGVDQAHEDYGSYPLNTDQLAKVTAALGDSTAIHPGVDYFLEPYALVKQQASRLR